MADKSLMGELVTLREAQLKNIEVAKVRESFENFYMPVQWVNRPNQDFRGFSGKIGSGKINVDGKDQNGNMVPIFKQGEWCN